MTDYVGKYFPNPLFSVGTEKEGDIYYIFVVP